MRSVPYYVNKKHFKNLTLSRKVLQMKTHYIIDRPNKVLNEDGSRRFPSFDRVCFNSLLDAINAAKDDSGFESSVKIETYGSYTLVTDENYDVYIFELIKKVGS